MNIPHEVKAQEMKMDSHMNIITMTFVVTKKDMHFICKSILEAVEVVEETISDKIATKIEVVTSQEEITVQTNASRKIEADLNREVVDQVDTIHKGILINPIFRSAIILQIDQVNIDQLVKNIVKKIHLQDLLLYVKDQGQLIREIL
jgi:hypothetical protein